MNQYDPDPYKLSVNHYSKLSACCLHQVTILGPAYLSRLAGGWGGGNNSCLQFTLEGQRKQKEASFVHSCNLRIFLKIPVSVIGGTNQMSSPRPCLVCCIIFVYYVSVCQYIGVLVLVLVFYCLIS